MLMHIQPIRTRVFVENEDIVSFMKEHVPVLPEKSILAITSKIVALAEGRTEIIHSDKEREELIRRESQWMMRMPFTWLTIKDGTVMASAGIDASNANGKIILLPENSFVSAELIRAKLKEHFKITDLGVIITDSRLLPLRRGVTGVALGYAGVKGLRDYRGTKDIYGRELKLSRTDIADGLATSAVVEMGEGSEQIPLVLITDARVEFTEKTDRNELVMNPKDDVYAPLFRNIDDATKHWGTNDAGSDPAS